MSFKWDWEKKELVEGESPKKVSLPEGADFVLLPALIAFGYWFVEYVAPYLGHLLFGAFL